MTDNRGGVVPTLMRAGLLTGISDGLFSSILSVAFYHSTVARLFQGVASVVVGRQALDGGAPAALLGVFMHFCVAFAWSAAFLFVVVRLPWVKRALRSSGGVLKIAALYGPLVWMAMSLIVIPLLTQRPPAITSRWWTQLIGHAPFVGMPIVWTASSRTP
jgi:hypothetical protein